jgi:hypothetical protein
MCDSVGDSGSVGDGTCDSVSDPASIGDRMCDSSMEDEFIVDVFDGPFLRLAISVRSLQSLSL